MKSSAPGAPESSSGSPASLKTPITSSSESACWGDISRTSTCTVAASLIAAGRSSLSSLRQPRQRRKGQMPSTVIIGTARTPFGKMGGGLASLDATELGAHAIEAALERSEVSPDQVEQVIYGQVLQAGQGAKPPRPPRGPARTPRQAPPAGG